MLLLDWWSYDHIEIYEIEEAYKLFFFVIFKFVINQKRQC